MLGLRLESIANGALQELFQRAYGKVLLNMKDPNTSYKEARKIVITLTFRENEERNLADMHVHVDTKLATIRPVQTKIAFDRNLRTGEIVSQEYGIPERLDSLQEWDTGQEQEEERHEENNIMKFSKNA